MLEATRDITPTGLYVYSNGVFIFHIPRADSARGNLQWGMRAIHISPPWGDVMIQDMRLKMVMLSDTYAHFEWICNPCLKLHDI